MSGRSGSRVAPHTPLVTMGGHTYAVTMPQLRLIKRAKQAGGSVSVRGTEIRSAAALSRFGELRDQADMRFVLAEGVIIEGPSR